MTDPGVHVQPVQSPQADRDDGGGTGVGVAAGPTPDMALPQRRTTRAGSGVVLTAVRRHQVPLVFLLASAVACVAFAHAFAGGFGHLHFRLAGVDRDVVQQIWFIGVTPHLLLDGHSPFLTDLINAPAGANLMSNTSMPALGILAAPLTLTAGPVAAFNALVILGFAGSVTTAFVAMRRWVQWSPAALAGALVYGFSPYMVSQGTMHLNLEFMVLPPLLLMVLEELLVRQRRPAWTAGLLLGLFAGVQLMIAAEVLAYSVVLAVLGIVLLIILFPRRVGSHVAHAATALGVGVLTFSAVCAYPLWVYFAGPQHVSGPAHSRGLLDTLLANPAQIIAPGASQLLGHGATGRLLGVAGDPFEGSGYLGLTLTIVVVVAVVRYRHLAIVRVLAGLAAIALVLSWGDTLTIAGRSTGIPLPFGALARLPLLDSAAAVRFTGFVALFVGALLAIGVDRFRHGWAAGAPGRRGATILASMLIIVALAPLAPDWPYPMGHLNVPAVMTSRPVRQLPHGAVVLVYPFPRRSQPNPMLWQALDGFRYRLVGGYVLEPGPDGGAAEGAQAQTYTQIAFEGCLNHPGLGSPLSAGERRAVQANLAAWHVRAVVLTPPPAAPDASLNCPAAVITAALATRPQIVAGSPVWLDVPADLARARHAAPGPA